MTTAPGGESIKRYTHDRDRGNVYDGDARVATFVCRSVTEAQIACAELNKLAATVSRLTKERDEAVRALKLVRAFIDPSHPYFEDAVKEFGGGDFSTIPQMQAMIDSVLAPLPPASEPTKGQPCSSESATTSSAASDDGGSRAVKALRTHRAPDGTRTEDKG